VVPATLKFRHETLHPAHDRRVGEGKAAFGHHLHQVTEAQLEAQIPPHTQDDDLTLEVPTLGQLT
jgi:hypothetical protein